MLIADHAPFGASAADLAQRFGVDMGGGFVADRENSVRTRLPATSRAGYSRDAPTLLVFSAENGLLGDHTIVRGRNANERVGTVIAFTGQSLSVPNGAAVLMKLGAGAVEVAMREEMQALQSGKQVGRSAAGRAQGIAMTFGKGRVAMFGEAAMFSAQLARDGAYTVKMGMNAEGGDDRQFALNVMRWLARALD